MMEAFPEFRGAQVVTAKASLVRLLDHDVPLDAAAAAIQKNEFAVVVDGGRLTSTRAPYTLAIDGQRLVISLGLVDADVPKMLGAPTAMTTEQLALWFPKVPGATVIHEVFLLEVRYEATEARAGYLAWQMVDLNTQGSWRVTKWPEGYERLRRPDGGGGGTPDAYALELVDSNTSARIALRRQKTTVEFSYQLVTEEFR